MGGRVAEPERGIILMHPRPAVQLSNVTKIIRGKAIVKNISLTVRPGEVFGLLGPNGAGKTTIIRMITGLISPTEGEIFINGKNLLKEFEAAISRVGAIVENPQFYPFLSGYQNLLHFARMSPGVMKKRIEEVISLVGLEERIDDPVNTYSLGMRQRLGVAQAMLHQPNVLILDEPTNGLDPAGIRELREYLRHLAHTEHTAVIVSSHLLSEMELMCDRVAILHRGQLIAVREVTDPGCSPEEKTLVRFEVDRTDKLTDILTDWEDSLKTGPEEFEILLERNRIPELVEKLVSGGIRIYGITRREKSLEDRFLEITEGDPVD
jgi:ABC-2 type transport system ATP-binding protein